MFADLIFEDSPSKWSTPINGPCVWVNERARVKIWRFNFSGNKVDPWKQQKLIPSKIHMKHRIEAGQYVEVYCKA